MSIKLKGNYQELARHFFDPIFGTWGRFGAAAAGLDQSHSNAHPSCICDLHRSLWQHRILVNFNNFLTIAPGSGLGGGVARSSPHSQVTGWKQKQSRRLRPLCPGHSNMEDHVNQGFESPSQLCDPALKKIKGTKLRCPSHSSRDDAPLSTRDVAESLINPGPSHHLGS